MNNTAIVESVEWGTEVFLSDAERDEGTSGWVVAKTCDGKAGHWFCVTHTEHFPNQLQKDFHLHDGTHVLAWICHDCGNVEVP